MCADGAPSRMAQQLGLVDGPAQTSCSRAYVEGGSHRFKADGVLFYNQSLLPGQLIVIYIYIYKSEGCEYNGTVVELLCSHF